MTKQDQNILVCVVDDEEAVRKVICAHLQRAGFKTVEAANGEQGLRVVLQANAAIAVVDIIMPDHEGLSMIRQLKIAQPETRVLAISGGGAGDTSHYLMLAREFGADDTLAKPFDGKVLIERIRRLLSTGRS